MPRRPGPRTHHAEPLPPVVLAREVDRSLAAARVRRNEWVRVRPGAYLDAVQLQGRDQGRTIALARIAALSAQLTVDHVVSHESAALVWGLPVLRVPAVTHVVQGASSRSGCSPDVVRHVLRLPDEQRTMRTGVHVTTLERTLVDCAMACSTPAGLVVADAALARGADRAACMALLASMAGRRGVVRARAVVEVADDGAESPGETLTRLAALRAGLPVPTTQIPVVTMAGTFWADLGWPEWKVLVEYDGAAKYDVGREALLAEKRREDALRAAGWVVVRLMAADVRDPARFLALLRRHVPAAVIAARVLRPGLA